MNLTIIIPTKNRKEWIHRALKYYISAKFKGYIKIADSSTDYNPMNLLESLSFSKIDTIEVINSIGVGAETAVYNVLKNVKTKYSVFIADDDIILTDKLEEGLKFLDLNPSYSGFTGRAFLIGTPNHKPFSENYTISKYNLIDSNNETSVERCVKFISRPSCAIFTVTTTNLATQAFEKISQLDRYHQSYIFGEIIHGLIICNAGKIKKMNINYCIRQGHLENLYSKLDFYKFISVESWTKSQILLRNLLFEIMKNDSRKDNYENVDLILNEFYTNTFRGILFHAKKSIIKIIIEKIRTWISKHHKIFFILKTLKSFYMIKINKRRLDMDESIELYLSIIKGD
jgi:glycosyltransferase domain-containing protein